MSYESEMRRTGEWLFRWRSYVPLVLIAVVATELRHFRFLGGAQDLDVLWECVCLGIGGFGLVLRAHVVGHAPARTSGRNTERGQVAERLNVTGLYSLVRNPLYLGNLFLWLGAALFLHDWRIVAIVVAGWWLFYERIVLAEEAFLERRFGDGYREWAARTPAFVPRLSGYVRPELPFSLRNVLKREYSGLFGFIAVLFALEVIGDRAVHGEWRIEPLWRWIFGANLLLYLTLRALKKHTRWLAVEGR